MTIERLKEIHEQVVEIRDELDLTEKEEFAELATYLDEFIHVIEIEIN